MSTPTFEFYVGAKVYACDTGAGETGPDGKPIPAVVTIDWGDDYFTVRFADGTDGDYSAAELEPR